MNIIYPITFDDPFEFGGRTVSQISVADLAVNGDFTDAGMHVHRNGFDASSTNNGRGLRVTNVSGVLNGDLVKWCPGPCGQHKPQREFDPTRTTDKVRDQSHCTACRSL